MYGTFDRCSSLISIPELDTSNVTDMNNMFYGCTNLQSLPRLNCSNVTNMNSFFGVSYAKPTNLTELGGFFGLKVTLDMSFLTKLTGQAIYSVMDSLSTTPNEGATLRLPSDARTKYAELKSETAFDEHVSYLTSVGWTISL